VAINPKKYVPPHKHSAKDFIDGYLPSGNNSNIGQAGNIYDYLTIRKQLILKDPADPNGDYINVNVKMIEDPLFPGTYNPFIEISEGLYMYKDAFTYGAFMTASPVGSTGGGCIQIGERFEHTNDPPRINITGTAAYLAITKGSTIENGYDNWDLTSKLTGLKCSTIYADNIKKVDGSSWTFGSTTISGLTIDANKDWNAKNITNIGELVASSIGLRRTGSDGEVKSDSGHLKLNSTGGIVFASTAFEALADTTLNHKLIFKPHITNGADPISLEMYNIMIEDPLFPGVYNPILYTDEGLWVQKDVYANGYIGSASPTNGTGGGCVMIGGGRFEHTNDPPRINLTGYATYVAITTNSTIHDRITGNSSAWHINDILGGLKCDYVNTADEGAVGYTSSFFTVNSLVKDLLLGTPVNKGVYVERNLHVYGNITCDGTYPAGSGSVSRSDISDFWDTAFWSNIPDKPTKFPTDQHNHPASEINSGDLELAQMPHEGITATFNVWTSILVDGNGHVTGGTGKTLVFDHGILKSATDAW
jgi:hypothetical protein